MNQIILTTPQYYAVYDCYEKHMRYKLLWHQFYQFSVNLTAKHRIRFSNNVHDVSFNCEGMFGYLLDNTSERMNMLIKTNNWLVNRHNSMRYDTTRTF